MFLTHAVAAGSLPSPCQRARIPSVACSSRAGNDVLRGMDAEESIASLRRQMGDIEGAVEALEEATVHMSVHQIARIAVVRKSAAVAQEAA